MIVKKARQFANKKKDKQGTGRIPTQDLRTSKSPELIMSCPAYSCRDQVQQYRKKHRTNLCGSSPYNMIF